jgi:hypothetical protein
MVREHGSGCCGKGRAAQGARVRSGSGWHQRAQHAIGKKAYIYLSEVGRIRGACMMIYFLEYLALKY